uniref:Uncharacterized protein n=1 Tax=Siphoviridae sp. ct3CA7 TaxID=2823561 RepID=A0A8S5LF33_9CAUD|nr:MAG TPA: hypothetical protein [Siphoviridae sp. ct3CA7]
MGTVVFLPGWRFRPLDYPTSPLINAWFRMRRIIS